MNRFSPWSLPLLCLLLVPAAAAVAQERKAEAPAASSIEAIDREFERDLAALERRRLERLAALAATQAPAAANATYEAYFQHALNARLYREAEPVAERVLRERTAAAQVLYLAAAANILAEVERGDFRQSVESLKAEVRAGQAGEGAEVLPLPTRLTLLEIFFQKLVQNDQFALAREALTLVRQNTVEPEIKEYAANRLQRLALIGQPAPPIVGTDLDGKPVRLADYQGQVVLVVFWASWCLPEVREIEEFVRVYSSYRNRGLRVIGINLDTASDGGLPLATVLPNVKRFVLDYNVPWPNLINGTGASDYAQAYAITDIPANVLIGRDGKVIQLDLDRANQSRAIEAALAAGR